VTSNKDKEKDVAAACLFTVKVGFDSEGMVQLEPSLEIVHRHVNEIIKNAIRVITMKTSMRTQEDFLPYTMAAAQDQKAVAEEDAVDLAAQVLSGDGFESCIISINNGLGDAFKEVMDYCQVFLPYNTIFQENEAVRGNMLELYEDISLEDIHNMIGKFKDQGESFTSIPMSSDVGIINIDSSELKSRLLPNPTQCLEALKLLLPELVTAIRKTLMEVFQGLNPQLSAKNQTVEDFVNKLGTMGEANNRMAELKRLNERQQNIMEIITEHNWSTSDEMKADEVLVKENFTQLQMNMSKCEASVDEEKTASSRR